MKVSQEDHGIKKKNSSETARDWERSDVSECGCESCLLGVCLSTQRGREGALNVMLEKELEGVEFRQIR